MQLSRKHIIRIISLIIILIIILSVTFFFSIRERPISQGITSTNGMINLPSPKTTGSMSVEEAINKRRSIREYTDKPLTLEQLSQLLWAAQGLTDLGRGLRAAPSAGATYPLELYIITGFNGVESLEEGVYRYYSQYNSLKQVLQGDLRAKLSKAALDQKWVAEAPINIVITAIYERTTARYGERGIRYVHMEAGHVAQNLYLQSTALDLGTVVIGAFHDAQVQDLLTLPSSEQPLYIMPIGEPR